MGLPWLQNWVSHATSQLYTFSPFQINCQLLGLGEPTIYLQQGPHIYVELMEQQLPGEQLLQEAQPEVSLSPLIISSRPTPTQADPLATLEEKEEVSFLHIISS